MTTLKEELDKIDALMAKPIGPNLMSVFEAQKKGILLGYKLGLEKAKEITQLSYEDIKHKDMPDEWKHIGYMSTDIEFRLDEVINEVQKE